MIVMEDPSTRRERLVGWQNSSWSGIDGFTSFHQVNCTITDMGERTVEGGGNGDTVTFTRSNMTVDVRPGGGYISSGVAGTRTSNYQRRERQDYIPPSPETYTYYRTQDPKVTVLPQDNIPIVPEGVPLNYPYSTQWMGTLTENVVQQGPGPTVVLYNMYSHQVRSPNSDSPLTNHPVPPADIFWTSGDLLDITDHFVSNMDHKLLLNFTNRPGRFIIGVTWLEEA